MRSIPAANQPYKLPPPLFHARCKLCWFCAAMVALVIASFWTLSLQWRPLLTGESWGLMGKFLGEFWPPHAEPDFLSKVTWATWETLAMSALGTGLAVIGGLLLALPASLPQAHWRAPTRWALNALRSVPELVWASLLLIAAGLGPMAGTMALALHTTGVLGRLFADAIENAPVGPAEALRAQGLSALPVFTFATLPLVMPQLVSYALYRWENNIRAAAVLGVVGAGGLGQMLSFHLGLFQMNKTATVLLAMLALVALVDALSVWLRRRLTQ